MREERSRMTMMGNQQALMVPLLTEVTGQEEEEEEDEEDKEVEVMVEE
jgi:hypothetical protein